MTEADITCATIARGVAEEGGGGKQWPVRRRTEWADNPLDAERPLCQFVILFDKLAQP